MIQYFFTNSFISPFINFIFISFEFCDFSSFSHLLQYSILPLLFIEHSPIGIYHYYNHHYYLSYNPISIARPLKTVFYQNLPLLQNLFCIFKYMCNVYIYIYIYIMFIYFMHGFARSPQSFNIVSFYFLFPLVCQVHSS